MIESRRNSLTLIRNRPGGTSTSEESAPEAFSLAANRRVLYLSKRETEVLQLVAGGASNLEIAIDLGISQQTVKNHLSSIFSKLRVRGRGAAVAQATRKGLVSIK